MGLIDGHVEELHDASLLERDIATLTEEELRMNRDVLRVLATRDPRLVAEARAAYEEEAARATEVLDGLEGAVTTPAAQQAVADVSRVLRTAVAEWDELWVLARGR